MYFYVKIYVRIGTNWTAVIPHYRTSLFWGEFLYMCKCRSETGFFWTKPSSPPLGLFSLQGLLDGPSAVRYGKERLQISHRFNVPQLEGQDIRLKSSTCFSVAQLQFCLVLLHQCWVQKLLLLLCQQESGFLKQGFDWGGGERSGRKSLYNSIVVQHRSSLRRWTRATGFHRFCSVSDISWFTEITKPVIFSPVIAD